MQVHSTRQQAVHRNDVGTLWTLQRDEGRARCALSWCEEGFELYMLIDDLELLAQRCRKQEDVFAVAEVWRARLRASGWSDGNAQVVVPRAKPDRRSV